MLARLITGSLVAITLAAPAFAETLGPDQAKQFVAGKLFAFSCFDGTRGTGRINHDGSVAGSVQFSGAGPTRYARLPVNTIQVRSDAVCASIKGLPFKPCFNLDKTSDASFRGSVSGMGFAYCDFRKHGNSMIMARAAARPRSLRAPFQGKSAEAASPEPARVEHVRTEPVHAEPLPELRRSTE